MKKFKLLFNALVFLSLFLTSCQSIKDGLTGRKQENSDEFLVQKKNPLVVPPDFMKLPKPQEEASNTEDTIIDEQTDIQKILKVNTETNNSSEKTFGKAEEFVLENIKK